MSYILPSDVEARPVAVVGAGTLGRRIAARTGTVEAAADLPKAVDRAWPVIESVPEKRDLKIEVFGTLDPLAAAPSGPPSSGSA